MLLFGLNATIPRKRLAYSSLPSTATAAAATTPNPPSVGSSPFVIAVESVVAVVVVVAIVAVVVVVAVVATVGSSCWEGVRDTTDLARTSWSCSCNFVRRV